MAEALRAREKERLLENNMLCSDPQTTTTEDATTAATLNMLGLSIEPFESISTKFAATTPPQSARHNVSCAFVIFLNDGPSY